MPCIVCFGADLKCTDVKVDNELRMALGALLSVTCSVGAGVSSAGPQSEVVCSDHQTQIKLVKCLMPRVLSQ